MLLYVSSWQLRLDPDGARRLNLDLLPGSSPDVIETIGVSQERCFIADVNKSEALFSRISVGSLMPTVRSMSCAIYEEITVSATRASEPDELASKPTCGYADLTIAQVTLRASSRTVEEIIRQDSIGNNIYYVELSIEGLERTTKTNNEGGLVGYTWHAPGPGNPRRESSVTAFAVHYHKSSTYEPTAAPAAPLRLADLTPILDTAALLLSASKRINGFLKILCVLLLLIIALLWRR